MKHPNREEWVPFLFGEAEPEAKKQLAEHLSACRECAEELGNGRKSLHRLDAWKTPRHKRRGMPALTPVFNLAAAALLVLGLGFGLGRWFSNSADAGQLRAALASSLKASLVPELRQELAGEFQSRLDQFQRDSETALANVKSEVLNASAAETDEALEQLLTLIRSDRAEDQEAVANWVSNLRKQHETDFVSLRKDLETVATTTDDRIRAAQLKLLELSSFKSSSSH